MRMILNEFDDFNCEVVEVVDVNMTAVRNGQTGETEFLDIEVIYPRESDNAYANNGQFTQIAIADVNDGADMEEATKQMRKAAENLKMYGYIDISKMYEFKVI